MAEFLVRHLVERGLAQTLALSLSAHNERRGLFEQLGLERYFVETFENNPSVMGLVRRLPRLRRHFADVLARTRPDVIVVPMMFGALLPLIDLAVRSKARLVYVAHDAMPHPGDSHRIGVLLTQRALFRLADDIVTVSETVREQLCRAVPGIAGKVRAERLTGLFKPKEMPRRPLSGPVKFLMPGRLVWYKGYERLAEALKLVGRDDFSVTVSGDGPYREKVADLFRNDPRVRVDVSWRTPGEHAELYRSHDVVLCPYSEASQSAVICEALSAGLPTIATPVGALPEQLGFGSSGIVLPNTTPQALADAMATVADGKFDYAGASTRALESLRTDAGGLTWTTLLSE